MPFGFDIRRKLLALSTLGLVFVVAVGTSEISTGNRELSVRTERQAWSLRMLAQRSAVAAREIKALIASSVEKVAAGSHHAGDAGRTMDEVLSQVQNVTPLIAEISEATESQSGGIGQVSVAVTQLDEVTQQNAALVEEAAAAAESLKQQARQLVDVVAVFRLA